MTEIIGGAVDLELCPALGRCRCEKCRICGYHKHTAVHGPVYGEPPGSKPFGHEFVADPRVRSRIKPQILISSINPVSAARSIRRHTPSSYIQALVEALVT